MDYRPHFLQTPYILICDDKLTPADRQVYAAIDWFSQLKKGKCIASNATIATIANMKKESVRNSISRLAKYGYLKVVLDDARHRKEIIPLVAYAKVDPSLNNDTPSLSSDGVSSTNDTPPSLNNEQKEKSIEGEKRIKRVAQKSPYQSKKYLEELPDNQQDLIDIQSRLTKQGYTVDHHLISKCSYAAVEWLESKGSKKSNYRSFLLGWIKRQIDNPYGKVQQPLSQPEDNSAYPNITEEYLRGGGIH